MLLLLLDRLGASISVLHQKRVDFTGEGPVEDRCVAEVLIRKVPDSQQVCAEHLLILKDLCICSDIISYCYTCCTANIELSPNSTEI